MKGILKRENTAHKTLKLSNTEEQGEAELQTQGRDLVLYFRGKWGCILKRNWTCITFLSLFCRLLLDFSHDLCSYVLDWGHYCPWDTPPRLGEFASQVFITLPFLQRQGQNLGLSSPFTAGPRPSKAWEGLGLAGPVASFPAALWLRLPLSTGLQLALLVHRLQTLNWHIHIVRWGSHIGWPGTN